MLPPESPTLAGSFELTSLDEDSIKPVSVRDLERPTSSPLEEDLERPPSSINEADDADADEYMTGAELWLLALSLSISILLVGLDTAIIATAIPTITTHFNSLPDVGWYGSGFAISCCALQPLAGKLFKYFDLKWTYMTFLVIFEVGSLLCAVANSSDMLIVGRVVAGIGAAGMFSGALAIIAVSVDILQRPIITAIVTSMFGVSSIAGPILGGLFTEKASWRWCFYINLPLGAVSAVILLFSFRPRALPNSRMALVQKMKHLDIIGILLFIPSVLMLLLAVQWGGHRYAWKSATIIGLFIGAGGMIIVFGAWEWRQQEEASIPPRIIRNKNLLFAALLSLVVVGSMNLVVYYMPIWFQVVKHESPVHSGIRLLPQVAGSLVTSVLAGALVSRYGLHNPFLVLSGALLAVGGGLLSTFKVSSGNARIDGVLVLFGCGNALATQMPLTIIMAILPQADIGTGSSLLVFFQFLGAAVFLAVGESVFVQQLTSSLRSKAPTVNADLVVAAGAQGLQKVVSKADMPGVLVAYNDAIVAVFYIVTACGGVGFLASFGVDWVEWKGSGEKRRGRRRERGSERL